MNKKNFDKIIKMSLLEQECICDKCLINKGSPYLVI